MQAKQTSAAAALLERQAVAVGAATAELWTLRQVGAALRRTPRAIYADIAAGRFGPDIVRLGRSVRVRADELREWIDAGAPSREEWLAVRGARWGTAR